MSAQFGAGNPAFTSTHWSVVLAARDGAPDDARAALASLCSTYWRPLYAYVRRCGKPVEDAQDITQSFFSHLLEKESLQHVDPALGRFRAFLLASLRNFLTNEWRREHAWRRGGAVQFVGIDDMTRAEACYAAGLARSPTPEQVYERNWALALLERTTARLSEEFENAGKSRIFECLKPYLAGDRQAARYAQVAAELEMSEVSVRVAVHRMRGRFSDLLRQEVAKTLSDPHDSGALEEELRYLLTIL